MADGIWFNEMCGNAEGEHTRHCGMEKKKCGIAKKNVSPPNNGKKTSQNKRADTGPPSATKKNEKIRKFKLV